MLLLLTDPARSCFRKFGVVGGDPSEAMLKISPRIIITTCPYCCLVWFIAQRTVKKKLCSHIHLLQKMLSERMANGCRRTEIAQTKGTVVLTFGMQNCIKLTLRYERPNGSSLTSLFTRKLRSIAFNCPFTNA